MHVLNSKYAVHIVVDAVDAVTEIVLGWVVDKQRITRRLHVRLILTYRLPVRVSWIRLDSMVCLRGLI